MSSDIHTTKEPQAIGGILDVVLEDRAPGFWDEPLISKTPDVQYLGGRSGLAPAFIRKVVNWFGETVVLEALRQFEPGRGAAFFVGICRRLERENEASA